MKKITIKKSTGVEAYLNVEVPDSFELTPDSIHRLGAEILRISQELTTSLPQPVPELKGCLPKRIVWCLDETGVVRAVERDFVT